MGDDLAELLYSLVSGSRGYRLLGLVETDEGEEAIAAFVTRRGFLVLVRVPAETWEELFAQDGSDVVEDNGGNVGLDNGGDKYASNAQG